MTIIKRDIAVSCPPEHVFAVLANVERLPEFSDMTVRVENGPGRPVEVGDTFDQVVKILGIELDTEWEVTGVVPGRSITVSGISKSNGKASLTETITPTGDGCRVDFEVDYDLPLGILGEIADKLIVEKKNEDTAEQILTKLKALCEGTLSA